MSSLQQENVRDTQNLSDWKNPYTALRKPKSDKLWVLPNTFL